MKIERAVHRALILAHQSIKDRPIAFTGESKELCKHNTNLRDELGLANSRSPQKVNYPMPMNEREGKDHELQPFPLKQNPVLKPKRRTANHLALPAD